MTDMTPTAPVITAVMIVGAGQPAVHWTDEADVHFKKLDMNCEINAASFESASEQIPDEVSGCFDRSSKFSRIKRRVSYSPHYGACDGGSIGIHQISSAVPATDLPTSTVRI